MPYEFIDMNGKSVPLGQPVKNNKLEFNTPDYYKIAGLIETKEILDMILNSGRIAKYNLTPSEIFDLGSLLKYRLRIGKKQGNEDSDLIKALNFEDRLRASINKEINNEAK